MNFMYHEEFAKNLMKLIDRKGIINVGGPKQTPYSFAKKDKRNSTVMKPNIHACSPCIIKFQVHHFDMRIGLVELFQ